MPSGQAQIVQSWNSGKPKSESGPNFSPDLRISVGLPLRVRKAVRRRSRGDTTVTEIVGLNISFTCKCWRGELKAFVSAALKVPSSSSMYWKTIAVEVEEDEEEHLECKGMGCLA